MNAYDKSLSDALTREIEYHERLYSGFAQSHFAKPAVRAVRSHLVSRLVQIAELGPHSRVLSLGCGIGDTELLLAPKVAEITGLDLSPTAIRQARQDAGRMNIRNARFLEGTSRPIPLNRAPSIWSSPYSFSITCWTPSFRSSPGSCLRCSASAAYFILLIPAGTGCRG